MNYIIGKHRVLKPVSLGSDSSPVAPSLPVLRRLLRNVTTRLAASTSAMASKVSNNFLIPSLGFCAGVLLSILLFAYLRGQIKDEARLRFEGEANEIQHAIEDRISAYVDVLRGVRALFSTSDTISRAQFHEYVVNLNLAQNYPGFQNINYADFVVAHQREAYEARVRQDTSIEPRGYPGFSIKPPGARASYSVLNYQVPMDSNLGTFGKDLAAIPAHAQALERGRDSGDLVASGRLIRVDNTNPHGALAMRLPVYRNGRPLSTVAERRAAYIGSVGAGFYVDTLMRNLFKPDNIKQMHFMLYDRGAVDNPAVRKPLNAENLLFDSNSLRESAESIQEASSVADVFATVRPMTLGGRAWEIHISAQRERMIDGVDAGIPLLVLIGGLLGSSLLFCTLYSVMSARSRAVSLANSITRDLRDSETSLAEAEHMAHLGSWSLDPVGGAMKWSDETFRIFGYAPAGECPDFNNFILHMHADDRARMRGALEQSSRTGQACKTECRIVPREGTMRWVQMISRPGREAQNCLLHGTIMDITDAKLSALLAAAEHRVTRVVASSEDSARVMPAVIGSLCSVLDWTCGVFHGPDATGERLQCSDSWNVGARNFDAFVGCRRQNPVMPGIGAAGRAWQTREPVIEHGPAADVPSCALPAGQHSVIAFPVMADGRVLGVIECFSIDQCQPEAAMARMLKSVGSQIGQYFQRKSVENKLRYVAAHDSLTGLPNRSMFQQALEHALSRAARYNEELAVLFIDLDRFKIVNDSFGHGAGDELLQTCARRLSACLRESDIVARFGGDEFGVMMEKFASIDDVLGVARKILDAVGRPFEIQGQEFLVTASIGISVFPNDGRNIEALLKNADVAMYRGKQAGNSYELYSSQMNEQSLRRVSMESSLRHAIERDELILHYQPKLDLRSGRIVGAEALVRWQHPEWGMVPPVQFIPLAEETGLIIDIGNWVLKTACAQNRAWQEQGLPHMCIAVNLSARQFGYGCLLQDIAAILADTGIAPDCLELEITESMMMQNAEHSIGLLRELKAMGIKLSIDDFGTGYSSLAYLRRLPIDCVKIDRFFIKDIPHEADDVAVTKGIISLAHNLRLRVIAEGIETAAQHDFLQASGCDEIQGYYFSKPMAAPQLAALLQHHLPHAAAVRT
ncbi:MAG: EAL domain-containing protein [Noviherbaspirillum sp.]